MKQRNLQFIHNSIVNKSLKILTRTDKRKLTLSIAFQIFLSFLDLIGVAIFGVLSALAITGIESNKPGNRVSGILKLTHLNQFSFKMQIALLGISAGLILLVRTLTSMWITWKTLFFLGRKSAEISQILYRRVLGQSLNEVKERSSQEIIYLVTNGIDMITLRVLGSFITIISDCVLLLIMFLGLLFLDFTVAICTTLTFLGLGYCLYLLSSKKVKRLSREGSMSSIKVNQTVMESIDTFHESVVRNTRPFYVKKFSILRVKIAFNNAYITFTPNIGKYVLEGVVTLGSLSLAGYQFFTKDAVHAIATLTVFMAAGSRIAPAALRIQQSSLQIKGNAASALDALELIEQLAKRDLITDQIAEVDFVHSGFVPEVKIRNLCFKYSSQSEPIIRDLNLEISPGSLVAVVGPSGAGKTTLADILLGLIKPDSGDVTISGLDSNGWASKWPGAIAYVPQNVAICDGTIAENVALGFEWQDAFEAKVRDVIKKAKLDLFVKTLPLGLETHVGERGSLLSGGQRQRLGIARALFTNPKLLVLDEATSSLDGETEQAISESLLSLKGDVTQIVIAHRLSTVRNADLVLYFNNGFLLAKGTFDEVRSQIPDFDRQASLMGL